MKCQKCDFETDKPHRDIQECLNVITGANHRVGDVLLTMKNEVLKQYQEAKLPS